ncbi:autotransporter outer membrane beta-barrel domain-containing protein [Rhizobium sp. 3T7]|uniref:autotransporter family protein n=1 Tax=Rhizobium sp. 3T7 TaxID=2874922 RepID=UPI001CCD36F8|nr:autotransporter outer membrane beta-barrel domain-containing protein [Rhizobium sp. 3T7]MBZ9793594.1 autotransporter outer membrane beta-barrel domain-containing protein [Rhizobium sp. 3T7]
MALSIAFCLPTLASAGEYTAATRGQLDDQIRAANADGDASSIIRLTGNVGVGAPPSLALATKSITIDTQGFVLSGADGTGATAGTSVTLQGNGGGTYTLMGAFRGGNANAGAAGQGLRLTFGAAATNNGVIQGGNSLSNAGGAGLELGGPGAAPTLVNNGTIRGGSGSVSGSGILYRSGTLTNAGTIEGGTGAAAIVGNSASANLSIINSGTIRAGAGQTNAIMRSVAATTGTLTLELQAGSVIEGNVVAGVTPTTDTLRLGGSASDSFDVSAIGAAAQYQNFDIFEKTGTSTWLLTGVGTTTTNWTIYDGTLLVGDHSAAASVIGDITNFSTLGGSGTIFGDVTNSGTIAPGNSIGTLTISGDYVGSGGALEIESVLGGDTSPTDRLVVTGNTSGTTNVQVINLGGSGAQTVEGIKIVDVGGTSAGTFTLQGDYVFQGDQAVVGGAYAYRLYQNGVSTPTDGDWYLRSTLIDPATPGEPASPLYQPGVPIYEAYPQLLLSLNGLPTLQQRVGDRYWQPGGKTASALEPEGVWLRTEGMHASIEPDTSTSGTSYDYDLFKLEGGLDGEFYQDRSGRLIGGLTVHYGTVSGDIASVYGDGKIDTTGYGVGATLTWYGETGFYVDAQSQATWYDSDLKSGVDGDLKNGNNGSGYAVSVETGKRLAASGPWSITPQAQLVYSSVNFDSFDDRFGARVSLDEGDSLIGRLGVALDREESWQKADGQTARAKLYGTANLYTEFLDGTAVDVADTGFASKNDRLWAGLTFGGSYNWSNERFSFYGEVAAKSSLENFGDSYAVSGTAGIRVKW